MFVRKETFIEKIVAPLPITSICFLGFMFYIYVYVKKLAEPDLGVLSAGLILLGTLLIFRSRIRSIFSKKTSFSQTKKSILPTPDEVIERLQRQKDADARYFGYIIFILSAMYLLFLEVI